VIKGKTIQLTATVIPTDSSDPIVYKTSDTNIATVDTKGLVMAVKKGTVIITATAGKYSKTSTITVALPAAGITISPTTASVAEGKTQQLTVTVTPVGSTNKVTYKSSDTSIATVNGSGLVTGVKKGRAIITATAGKYSKTSTIMVTLPAAGITITPATATVAEGKTQQLTVAPIKLPIHQTRWVLPRSIPKLGL
jgi:uncharacterized protein YjdB